MSPKITGDIPSRSPMYVLSFTAAVLGCVIMSMTPLTVTLALRLSEVDPIHKNDAFGWAIAIGNFVQLLLAPLAGQLSDATTSRWGMRKPWILAGTLGSMIAACAIANATSVSTILIAWAAMASFLAVMMTPLFACISDQFPPQQHGVVSGLCGATPLIGITTGSWVVHIFPLSATTEFIVPTSIGALLILQYASISRDKVSDAGSTHGFNLRTFARSFHFRPSANPSFTWYLLVVVLIYIGAVTMQDYMVYLLQDAIKVSREEISRWTFLSFLVAYGSGCGFSVIAGVVSDKIGRRKPVYTAGALLLAGGLLVQGISHEITLFLVGILAGGIGYGILTGVTWALAVETSGDSENAARDMGLVNVALVAPGLVVPVIARLADPERGYTAMYLAAALLPLLALPMMTRIRNVR